MYTHLFYLHPLDFGIKSTLPRLKWYITITIQRSVREARQTQRLALKQSVRTARWLKLNNKTMTDIDKTETNQWELRLIYVKQHMTLTKAEHQGCQ